MARAAGAPTRPAPTSSAAMALFEEEGATHPRARVSARLGEVMWDTGRLREALDRMDAALELLTAEEPDADLAALAAQVGRFKLFAGEPDVALERTETALELAEALGLPEVLSQAINTKAMLLSNQGRVGEAGALVRYALDVALEHDIPSAALRGYNNIADLDARADRYEQAAAGYRDGLALARRVGSRQLELMFVSQTYPLYALGHWDEALAGAAQVPEEVFSQSRFPFVCFLGNSVSIYCHRGELDEAEELIRRYAVLRDSADISERTSHAWPEAQLRLAQGDNAEALRLAQSSWDAREAAGGSSESVKESFPIAVAAALLLGERARADDLLAGVESAGHGVAAIRPGAGDAVPGAHGRGRRRPRARRPSVPRRGRAHARAGDALPDGGHDARARRGAGRLRRRRRGRAHARRGAGGVRAAPGGLVARPGGAGRRQRRRPHRELVGPLNTVGTGGARAGRPPGSPGGASAPGEPRPSLSATAGETLRLGS